jgi:hypothetical protein
MEQIDWLKEYSNTFTTNKPLNFQLIKDKLESQKTTLASFMHYLGNIIKSIDDNNYNSIMIDELCKMIQEYYAKNTNTDSEESTSKTSESSGVQFFIKNEDSKEDSKNDSKLILKDIDTHHCTFRFRFIFRLHLPSSSLFSDNYVSRLKFLFVF